jgi:N-acetylglucosamine malate deacetylase 2
MNSRNWRLTVVLAHPDDESFPMGGTIARYAANGADVELILATYGEAGIEGMDLTEAAQFREREARAACAILGVRRVRFLGFADGHLTEADESAAIDRLANMLTDFPPDIVITFGPDGISGHPDHVAISRWTTAAFDRTTHQPGDPRKLYYIAPSEATRQGCGVPPRPDLVGGPMAYIDIEAYRVIKVRAAQQHCSQNPPFSGSPESEASSLVCHEVFRLARWAGGKAPADLETDLLAGLDQGQGELVAESARQAPVDKKAKETRHERAL